MQYSKIAFFVILLISQANKVAFSNNAIPDFPKNYKTEDNEISSINDNEISDFGRYYDRFINVVDNYQINNKIKNGNNDPISKLTNRKDNIKWDLDDYHESSIRRTRVLVSTTDLTLSNPEFMSQSLYSYYLIDENADY